ncbi:MAG: sulfotransferase family protein, partial [Verrucomicrobiota bacterium]|nr:sulfotransferase family protein [Verrucomicrobiota bacterium]
MQMLSAGGLPVLTDEGRAADENNPRGYFEFEPVKRLRTDRSWLEQARGRAVKIIHLLIPELPTDGRFKYRVILMKRSLDEILVSQRVMLQRQGKPSADAAVLRKIFQQQLLELESYLAGHITFSTLSVDYQSLIENPLCHVEEINSFLGGGLDVAPMARAVDPALYRQRL